MTSLRVWTVPKWTHRRLKSDRWPFMPHSHGLSMHSLTHAHIHLLRRPLLNEHEEMTGNEAPLAGKKRTPLQISLGSFGHGQSRWRAIWLFDVDSQILSLTPGEDQEQIADRIKWNTHWPLSHKDTNHDKSKMISDLIQKRTGNL